jgi:chromate transporter
MRIGRRALRTPFQVALAAAAFVAIFFAELPFPVIVVSAGAIGFIAGRLRPQLLPALKGHGSAGGQPDTALLDDSAALRPGATRSALRAGAIALVLWLVPVVVLVSVLGAGHVFAREAVFFSQSAVVTFGGAYAVLAYIAQEAVSTYGWLRPGEMLTGLGMAETTPGPLIMVVQFVGFMAAYRNPGMLHPVVAGLVGSAVTTWVTFTPCFLFVFAGAPFIERLRGNHTLNAALSAITAAVVGVVLNLAVWFTLNTAFARVESVYAGGFRLLIPQWRSADLAAIVIMVVAALAIFRVKLSVMKTLALCAVLGLLAFVLTGGPL